jgi:hypothetical protein
MRAGEKERWRKGCSSVSLLPYYNSLLKLPVNSAANAAASGSRMRSSAGAASLFYEPVSRLRVLLGQKEVTL